MNFPASGGIGVVPYWQMGLLAVIVILLAALKRTRLAICAVVVFCYYWFFRAYWPNVSSLSEGVTGKSLIVIGAGIAAGLFIVYLLVIRGD